MSITNFKILITYTIFFGDIGRGVSMRSHVRKTRNPRINKKRGSNLQKETIGEQLGDILENISLKNVPLEERRKEAQKPLFLIRYE